MTGAWASAAALWSSVRQRPSTRRETTRGPEPELDLSQELDTLTHFCLFVSNKRFTFQMFTVSKVYKVSKVSKVSKVFILLSFPHVLIIISKMSLTHSATCAILQMLSHLKSKNMKEFSI